jgi:hypothetical protein
VGRVHGAKRLPGGGVRMRLAAREREVLRSLPDQLRPLLAGEVDVEGLGDRLYPSAYPEDPLAELEYRELAQDEVVSWRVGALDTFAETLERGEDGRLGWSVELTPEEAEAWLSALNDARLTLGVLLGIVEEGDWEGGPDEDNPSSMVLAYLSWLQEDLIVALMGSLEG